MAYRIHKIDTPEQAFSMDKVLSVKYLDSSFQRVKSRERERQLQHVMGCRSKPQPLAAGRLFWMPMGKGKEQTRALLCAHLYSECEL